MNSTQPTSVTIQFTIQPLILLEPANVFEFGQTIFSEDETLTLKPDATAPWLAAHLSGLLTAKVATDPELAGYTPSAIAPAICGAKPEQAQDFLSCTGHLTLRNADGDEFIMRVRVLSVQ